MTTEQNTQITKLETRVRQLILQHQQLRQEKVELERRMVETLNQVAELKSENQHLQGLYANLKTARILELNDDDTRKTKDRLTKLVREVDNCIAILKAK